MIIPSPSTNSSGDYIMPTRKTIKVFHLAHSQLPRDESFTMMLSGDPALARNLWNKNSYKQVAEVRTADMEEAFRLTNNIHDSWSKNDHVKTDFPRCRSTSVGDIMGVGDDLFVVSSFGFQKI